MQSHHSGSKTSNKTVYWTICNSVANFTATWHEQHCGIDSRMHNSNIGFAIKTFVECVFLLSVYIIKDMFSMTKYCSSEAFWEWEQLAFFPKWVWALRKSVHLPKRITFSGLQTTEANVLTSSITPTSGLRTCHKPPCCKTHTHSYQLLCNKSCHSEAYYVQYLLTAFQGRCFDAAEFKLQF